MTHTNSYRSLIDKRITQSRPEDQTLSTKKKKKKKENHRIKLKESEKKDKYLDLAMELNNIEHEGDDYTYCDWCFRYSN